MNNLIGAVGVRVRIERPGNTGQPGYVRTVAPIDRIFGKLESTVYKGLHRVTV